LDSGAAAAKAPLRRPVFIKKATAICNHTTAKVDSEGIAALRKVERESGNSERKAKVEYIPEWLVPTLEDELAELRSLGAPSGDEKQIDAVFATLEEVVEKAKTEPEKYLYLQVHAKYPYLKVEELATAYGIPECGQP
jgi:ABC-type transporter Mla MlaB component